MVRGAELAAKPVNDTELLTVGWTLPGGFGYVLNEMHFNIEVDTASDWETTVVWRLSQPNPQLQGMDYLHVIQFALGGRNGLAELVRSTGQISAQMVRTPLIPRSTGSTQAMSASNLKAAVQAAGEVNFVASFWEYDLEQIQYFPVHAPVGVYSR